MGCAKIKRAEFGSVVISLPCTVEPMAVTIRLIACVMTTLVITADGFADAPVPLADAKDLWSLQPIRVVELPDVENSAWPRTEVDYFVLTRLEASGLTPVRNAGPRTLIRRAYFDLMGLPPAPEEIDAYLADDSPSRFEQLVDRLLQSPRFGERWGRHWLDVVRFAESSGKEFNFSYPHAWPYRDYVIDALNADKPYDQFLQEQLAGDLLHGDRKPEEQIDELLIATGFLAIGPKRHNNGDPGFTADMVDELIDVTMRSVLGMTVACARCHDHKFDPISSRDYYALAGIFHSTNPLFGTIAQKYSNHPTDLVPLGPNGHAMHQAAEEHDGKISEASEKLSKKQKELNQAEKALRSQGSDQNETEAAKTADTDVNSEDDSPESDEKTKLAALKTEIAELEKTIEQLKSIDPPRPQYSVSARDRDEPVNAKIAIRGNPGELGDEVPRGYLSCLTVASASLPNTTQSGRLELARWLTSQDNPLTARVMVNRIWRHLFGAGLVKTVDNFGQLGSRPSHPELLDWLASDFMDAGWSIKHTVRKLMLSRAYQLSSMRNETGIASDPENVLLWRMAPRRLEVEAIRDALLATSGELELNRPMGSPVAALGDQLVRGVGLEKLHPPSSHRSVYLPVIRGYPSELFELFDFPSADLVSGDRVATTGPLQDLYLRNHPRMQQYSQTAARLLLEKLPDDDVQRVQLAYERAYNRLPSTEEQEASLALVRDVLKSLSSVQTDQQQAENESQEKSEEEALTPEVQAWASLCHALFASAEFRHLVDID